MCAPGESCLQLLRRYPRYRRRTLASRADTQIISRISIDGLGKWCALVEKDLIAKVKPALRSHGRFICDRNTRRRANLFRPLNNKWRDLRVSKRICPDVGPVSFDKTAR